MPALATGIVQPVFFSVVCDFAWLPAKQFMRHHKACCSCCHSNLGMLDETLTAKCWFCRARPQNVPAHNLTREIKRKGEKAGEDEQQAQQRLAKAIWQSFTVAELTGTSSKYALPSNTPGSSKHMPACVEVKCRQLRWAVMAVCTCGRGGDIGTDVYALNTKFLQAHSKCKPMIS